mmetsp:Transcript_13810/g.24683  ORF Transcript_13810/g.24683 Transcript_13810/m.24683 type:complete len:555 (-) Transcript_13810:92-1756(-)
MGRKKFDKKNAHRFVVVHRSQMDPEYYNDEASRMVLHPANKATAKALHRMGMGDQIAGTSLEKSISKEPAVKELREVDDKGFPVDGYDYKKHLSSISGGATFVSSTGAIKSSNEVLFKPKKDAEGSESASAAPSRTKEGADDEEEFDELYRPEEHKAVGPTSTSIGLPQEMFASDREYGRMLEAITLSTKHMDPELKILLEAEGDAEVVPDEMKDCIDTLEDDFMEQLMTAEKECPEEAAFDYDAHVARLMAEADSDFESEDEFDVEGVKRQTRDEVLEDIENSRPVREVDLHFEAVLANEYNDEDIGELEHAIYDERVAGAVENDNDHLQQLVQEFRTEASADLARNKEYGATANNQDIREIQHVEVAAAKAKEVEKRALLREEALANALETPAGADDEDAESVLSSASELDEVAMLNNFGYQDRPKATWDCETIVSTYSILDNHPSLITVPSARRKKAQPVQPMDPLSDDELEELDEAAAIPHNAGIRRDKKETAEEKKARKQMIKEQKRLRREEKRSTKQAFKSELKEQKRQAQALKAAAAPPRGVSTFKF